MQRTNVLMVVYFTPLWPVLSLNECKKLSQVAGNPGLVACCIFETLPQAISQAASIGNGGIGRMNDTTPR